MERKLTSNELKFGILMHDLLLFPLYFWKADLTIPHTRKDLPEEWRGKQVVTKEQKLMLCDQSQKSLVCTGRKIAKTLMIERDVIQMGVLNDRKDGGLDEAMFFTPRDSHMAPVRARIFSKVNGVPLFRLFKTQSSRTEGGAGVLQFRGNLKWHFRLEGISGSDVNMAGLRAKYVLGDECLPGDALVYTPSGPIPIEDVQKDHSVYGIVDGAVAPTRVIRKQGQGIRPLLEIRTLTRRIRLTENHPLLVAHCVKKGKAGNPATCSSQWELIWKEASQLGKGDIIAICNGTPHNETSEHSPEFLELCGMFLGDGNFTIQTSHGKITGNWSGMALSVPEGDKARQRAVELIANVTGRPPSCYRTNIVAYNANLARRLSGLGFVQGALNKRIPEWCFSLPLAHKKALISGLLITDGYLNNSTWYFEVASEGLVHDLRSLAISCGLRVSNVYHRVRKNPFYEGNPKTRKQLAKSWSVTIKEPGDGHRAHNYKMVMPRGVNRTPLPENIVLERVRAIERLPPEQVWDIQTESGNFIADGVVVHNCAFGNEICHNSRGQTALPEARWKYCGVPNGIRGTPFYRLDQTSAGRTWTRHKYPSSANPLYRSKEAWETLLEFYGGVNSQGFITQALGEWGTEVFSSFPPGTIAIKDLPFLYIELTNKEVGDAGEEVRLSKFIQLPDKVSPQAIYQAIIGWDYGFSPDPCVMTVFYRTSAESLDWYELLRLRMMRVPRPNQGRIVQFLNKLLGGKIMGIVTDDSGCLQTMEDIGYQDLVWWANSAGVVPRLDRFGEPLIDESGKPINIKRKEWANEEFKQAMMYAPLKVPNPFYMWLAEDDEQLINELAGTIERRRGSGHIEFIAPGRTPGSQSPDDHSSDSCRFGAIAIRYAIAPKDLDDRSWEAYAAALGWAGDGSWKAPWDLEAAARPLYPI